MMGVKSHGIIKFFVYCLLGWVWESMYVSVKKRELVNRGFLNGPWIPIYGFGAFVVLFATYYFRDNFFLMFISGSIAATVLEYITGAVMEKVFRVRYWDYSSEPFNINGHVCLKCSFVWGIFSIFIVKYIDPFADRIIFRIPGGYINSIAVVLILLFVWDTIFSARDALYLKDTVKKISDASHISTSAEKILSEISEFTGTVSFISPGASTPDNKSAEKSSHCCSDNISMNIDMQKRHKTDFYVCIIEKCDEQLRLLCEKFPTADSDKEYERLLEYEYMLLAVKESAECAMRSDALYPEKKYKRAVSVIRRNPSAGSGEYIQGMIKLKEHIKRKKC